MKFIVTDIPLFVSAVYFTIGIYVVVQNQRGELNWKFGLFTTCFAVYCLSISMLFTVEEKADGLFWMHVNSRSGVFLPITFYMFIDAVLPSRKSDKKRKDWFFLGYIIFDALLHILFTVHLVRKGVKSFDFRELNYFYAHPNSILPVFAVFLIFVISHCICRMVRSIKLAPTPQLRKFIWELFVLTFVSIVIGLTDVFFFMNGYQYVNLFKDRFEFPPLSIITVLLFVGYFSYAIIKRKFIDITYSKPPYREIYKFVKPLSIFVVVSLSVTILFYLTAKPSLKILFVILVSAFFLFVLYLFHAKTSDKTDKIEAIAFNLGKSKSLEEISSLIKDAMMNYFGANNAIVMFAVEGVFDFEDLKKISEWTNEKTNAMEKLIEYTIKNKKVLDLTEISIEKSAGADPELQPLITAMNQLDLEILIPLLFQGRVTGIVGVGSKERGFYTAFEIGLLNTFALTASIAHENMRLIRRQQEMIRDLVHELKTPLTSLAMMAEYLHKTLDGDEKKREAVETIVRETERYDLLINNVRDIVNFDESLRHRYSPTDFDVQEVIRESLDLFTKNLETKNISCEFQSQPETLRVTAEPTKLKQVLVNLISNALKYTPPGGSVAISAEHGENDDYVKISVKDTGIGIKREDQSKIFHEKYYRTDESKKTGSGGAGVGLIVCRRLVEQFGGKIGVESEPKKGSTFWVTIPSSHLRRGGSTDDEREGDYGKEENINRG